MFRFILLTFGVCGILGLKYDHTKVCQVCNRVKDPSTCSLMTCKGEMICFVKVELINGEYLFSKGCMHGCHDHDSSIIVGKRVLVHEPHGSHDLSVCRKCCLSAPCDGCSHYSASNIAMVPSTPRSTTPTSAVSKAAVCRDHEEDGFLCSEYDVYNFCTDTASGLHKLAVDRCPKHCGFCDANGNFIVTKFPSPTAPTTTTTVVPVTVAPSGKSTTTAVFNLDASELKIEPGCFDSEDEDFSCAAWAAYGFCTRGTGTGYVIAVKRCSKYCGFCS